MTSQYGLRSIRHRAAPGPTAAASRNQHDLALDAKDVAPVCAHDENLRAAESAQDENEYKTKQRRLTGILGRRTPDGRARAATALRAGGEDGIFVHKEAPGNSKPGRDLHLRPR